MESRTKVDPACLFDCCRVWNGEITPVVFYNVGPIIPTVLQFDTMSYPVDETVDKSSNTYKITSTTTNDYSKDNEPKSKLTQPTSSRSVGNVKHLPCTFCRRRFLRQCDRRKHTRLTHKDELLKCDICEKTNFITRMELNAHIKICHEKQVPPYYCILCPSRFYVAEDLIFHFQFHLEVLYRSAVCG